MASKRRKVEPPGTTDVDETKLLYNEHSAGLRLLLGYGISGKFLLRFGSILMRRKIERRGGESVTSTGFMTCLPLTHTSPLGKRKQIHDRNGSGLEKRDGSFLTGEFLKAARIPSSLSRLLFLFGSIYIFPPDIPLHIFSDHMALAIYSQ